MTGLAHKCHVPSPYPLSISFFQFQFFAMLLLSPPKFPSQTRFPFPSTPKLKVVSETDVFPSFVPKEVHRIKDPFARSLAKRIQRLPVSVRFSEDPIMSSCVKPMIQNKENPIVLLHGFDSSCLEWRYTYPLLEEAGYETWAVDILGWGFSDLEKLPSCDVVSKRDHFYQFWKSHIKKAMVLVGPSLGSAVAIDFAVNYPEAVEKLVLIDASVYAEGTGNLATLPRAAAYAGAYVLKSIPLRLYANFLSFRNLSFTTSLDWTNVGRLHCLLPWWEDATVDFMTSGGYNVVSQIEKLAPAPASPPFLFLLLLSLGSSTNRRRRRRRPPTKGPPMFASSPLFRSLSSAELLHCLRLCPTTNHHRTNFFPFRELLDHWLLIATPNPPPVTPATTVIGSISLFFINPQERIAANHIGAADVWKPISTLTLYYFNYDHHRRRSLPRHQPSQAIHQGQAYQGRRSRP